MFALLAGMIERLEEETRANGYIVKEQLPKDIASRRKMIQDLQKVVAVPAMGQSDLDELNNQVTTITTATGSNSSVSVDTTNSKTSNPSGLTLWSWVACVQVTAKCLMHRGYLCTSLGLFVHR